MLWAFPGFDRVDRGLSWVINITLFLNFNRGIFIGGTSLGLFLDTYVFYQSKENNNATNYVVELPRKGDYYG